MKNIALFPKKEYALVASITPRSGIPAMAIRLVIDKGIRFVDHNPTQRKNKQRTLYPGSDKPEGVGCLRRNKNAPKYN